ncbi:calmodulin regulator protein PCP4 [Cyprinodon tularosa]|uniref:Purkinje cell protein 4 n=1 Tax=Cyprinodon variegatus TaxID=28743 RepID=A0A3Q2DNS9_CYPVA|nr:PREDICTED: Purkinje cell protein 4-like [Cyprinodon variegatus]XP_038141457.1 calmodulin regulator protein PCP4 [Cyprinodon tularosa]
MTWRSWAQHFIKLLHPRRAALLIKTAEAETPSPSNLLEASETSTILSTMSERQGSGPAAGNKTTSGGKDESKADVPEDFDIDMDAPETEKAAVTIQSQFRKFQKKKRDEKS